ncbi:hypothetical protein MAA8898_02382 [Maliponia aquimaris]|uniref:Uncharacterized protein n=1 Tax=Maliponia aquimaris TaxID=1673631 RepID=A0A238KGH2_9RHOB|nr:hypothetical protein MAA8898_02382 [Maliponia aquimaris]
MKTCSCEYFENTCAISKLVNPSTPPNGKPPNGEDAAGLDDAGIINFASTCPDRGKCDVAFLLGADPYETKTVLFTEWMVFRTAPWAPPTPIRLAAGTVQTNGKSTGGGPCDRDLRVRGSGPVILIGQVLGAGAKACRLDPAAPELAVVEVARHRDDRSELVPINRFGRHEAEGLQRCCRRTLHGWTTGWRRVPASGPRERQQPCWMTFAGGLSALPVAAFACHLLVTVGILGVLVSSWMRAATETMSACARHIGAASEREKV